MVPGSELPKLPKITNKDLLRRVFTHRSLDAPSTIVFEDPSSDPSLDNERLEFLGDSVLHLCTTTLLHDVYSSLRCGPATRIKSAVVSNNTLCQISRHYKLFERLHVAEENALALKSSVKTNADVFEAYIGGVYLEQGFESTKEWLHKLLKPYMQMEYARARTEYGLGNGLVVQDPIPDPSAIHPTHDRKAPTEPEPEPVIQIGYTALLNEYCATRGKRIEFVCPAINTDPLALAIWHVDIIVDAVLIASAEATTKKAAKNHAAMLALQVMNVDTAPIVQTSSSHMAPIAKYIKKSKSKAKLKQEQFRILASNTSWETLFDEDLVDSRDEMEFGGTTASPTLIGIKRRREPEMDNVTPDKPANRSAPTLAPKPKRMLKTVKVG